MLVILRKQLRNQTRMLPYRCSDWTTRCFFLVFTIVLSDDVTLHGCKQNTD